MSDPRAGPCSLCGFALGPSDFESGQAIVLLGKRCCVSCVEAKSLSCHGCRKPLSRKDFDAGRAVTLLGNRYCECCLIHALLVKRERRAARRGPAKTAPVFREPAVPADRRDPAAVKPETRLIPLARLETDADSRRAYSRFVPPVECTLVLKPTGLRALLCSNLVRLWVDVSEGGLRAVVEGSFQKDDVLQGQMLYPPLRVKFELRVVVRHAKPSTAHPGCAMLGLQFEDPGADLQGFIREVLAETPSIALETSRRAKPAAAPADPQPPAARPA